MKKFFLLVAAVAAMAVNAQVYDLSTINFTQADLTVTNGTVADDAAKAYFTVKNTPGETVVMTIAQLPNIEFSYKNSSEKTAFKVYYNAEGKEGNGKIQMDGNQRDITFTNVTPGTEIKLTVASKGDTGAQFVDGEKGTAFTGCVANNPAADGIGTALPGKTAEAGTRYEIAVTAIAPTVTIRETVGGYVLYAIEIGGSNNNEAIDNVEAGVKTVKTFENGQLVIIKNGVKYNALGAAL